MGSHKAPERPIRPVLDAVNRLAMRRDGGLVRCGRGKKITYRTLAKARRANRHFNTIGDHRQWVYSCKYCPYFHLTSEPQEARSA
jgi:hypothetical protein